MNDELSKESNAEGTCLIVLQPDSLNFVDYLGEVGLARRRRRRVGLVPPRGGLLQQLLLQLQAAEKKNSMIQKSHHVGNESMSN